MLAIFAQRLTELLVSLGESYTPVLKECGSSDWNPQGVGLQDDLEVCKSALPDLPVHGNPL